VSDDAHDDADEAEAVDDDALDDVITDDDEVTDDEEEWTPPPRRRDEGDRVRARELVLLVIAVLGIAGTILFGLRWKELHDDEQSRQDVEQAAGEFLNALFEWDGSTIDADFDRILDFATGQFEEEAQATFADDETRQALREGQAASRAEGLDIFVRSLNGGDARVFAVVDVTAVNAEFPDRRADTVRIEIGMTRTGGEWKVYDVNLLDGLNLGLPADPAAGG
jgi:hypothetical protein